MRTARVSESLRASGPNSRVVADYGAGVFRHFADFASGFPVNLRQSRRYLVAGCLQPATNVSEVLPPGYELLSDITQVETLARGKSVRQRRRLNRKFGKGHWRKMKGTGLVRFPSGDVHWTELHWFEAHGIGKREIKIKKTL